MLLPIFLKMKILNITRKELEDEYHVFLTNIEKIFYKLFKDVEEKKKLILIIKYEINYIILIGGQQG